MYDIKEGLSEFIRDPIAEKRVGIIRLQMVRERRNLYGMKCIANSHDAARLARPLFDLADREMLVVLSLSNSNEPLALEVAAVGGLDTCIVDMKNIFKHSILNNARSIVCFHNHPGGNPSPSDEDTDITEKMKKAGELLNILVLDHIVIGSDSYYSFKEQGAFSFEEIYSHEENIV